MVINTANVFEYVINEFIDIMYGKGYAVHSQVDKLFPRVIAHRPNHYTIELFLDPHDQNIIINGHRDNGSAKERFRFSLSSPFDNIENRFDELMTRAEPFFQEILVISIPTEIKHF